jgi:hypothetical protein
MPIQNITWHGTSGTVYTFQIDPIGTAYRVIPGVYIFCKLALNGRWDPVYIGEAGDLNERVNVNLHLHHRWECIRRHSATHICTLHVPGNDQQRLAIETDIRAATPNSLCNRQ